MSELILAVCRAVRTAEQDMMRAYDILRGFDKGCAENPRSCGEACRKRRAELADDFIRAAITYGRIRTEP